MIKLGLAVVGCVYLLAHATPVEAAVTRVRVAVKVPVAAPGKVQLAPVCPPRALPSRS